MGGGHLCLITTAFLLVSSVKLPPCGRAAMRAQSPTVEPEKVWWGWIGSASVGSAERSETARNARFLEWARARGAAVNFHLKTNAVTGVRGAFAANDFKNRDAFVEIPAHLIITEEVYSQLPIPSITGSTKFPAQIHLALWLLHERANATSDWGPYFDVLPSKFPASPFSLSEEMVAELQNGFCGNQIQLLRHSVPDLFNNYVRPALLQETDCFSDAYLTYDNFLVAYNIVRTRAWPSPHGTSSLVPLAGMFNYRPKTLGLNRTLKKGDELYFVAADRPYQKGDELFVDYGYNSRCDFFKTWHFVPESVLDPSKPAFKDLRFEHFSIPFRHHLMPEVRKLISELVDKKKSKILYGKIPFELLQFHRAAHVQYGGLGWRQREKLAEGGPLCVLNEERAYKSVMAEIDDWLAVYTTTVEEDTALLKHATDSTLRSLIAVRIAEKRALANLKGIVKNLVDSLADAVRERAAGIESGVDPRGDMESLDEKQKARMYAEAQARAMAAKRKGEALSGRLQARGFYDGTPLRDC